jgi:hypothetical protein
VPLTDLVREVERLKGSGPGAPGGGGGESVSAPREAPKPAHPKPAPPRASAADAPSPRPEPATPAAGPGSPQKEKLAETALKDPGVRAFMDVFRGQIYTVEPISGTKENNES